MTLYVQGESLLSYPFRKALGNPAAQLAISPVLRPDTLPISSSSTENPLGIAISTEDQSTCLVPAYILVVV